MSQQGGIRLSCLVQTYNVLLGDDQYMGGSLWLDILKRKNGLILKNFFGGDLAGNDFAENAIVHNTQC